jgi:hypothetical protein
MAGDVVAIGITHFIRLLLYTAYFIGTVNTSADASAILFNC